jgi:large subunit ribosomal protein L6
MSRIGNRVLTIPAGVEVKVEGNKVTTKGPKGTLELEFQANNVDVKVEGNEVRVTRKDESKVSKQLHGTTNSNINNMLIGVSEGFKRELEINGVGYRFQVQGNKLIVTAGYSHNVELVAPEGIKMEMPDKSQTELIISGYDKQAVSEFAANIRKIRKPEPYKGKGIKFKEEHIRRKEGKKAA